MRYGNYPPREREEEDRYTRSYYTVRPRLSRGALADRKATLELRQVESVAWGALGCGLIAWGGADASVPRVLTGTALVIVGAAAFQVAGRELEELSESEELRLRSRW